MRTYKEASALWDLRVERIAANLIKQGVPPWQAVAAAVRRIRRG